MIDGIDESIGLNIFSKLQNWFFWRMIGRIADVTISCNYIVLCFWYRFWASAVITLYRKAPLGSFNRETLDDLLAASNLVIQQDAEESQSSRVIFTLNANRNCFAWHLRRDAPIRSTMFAKCCFIVGFRSLDDKWKHVEAMEIVSTARSILICSKHVFVILLYYFLFENNRVLWKNFCCSHMSLAFYSSTEHCNIIEAENWLTCTGDHRL